MAKKSFKDSSETSVASIFMSESAEKPYVSPAMCRLNLRIRKEYKDYLEHISWNNHTNMTQYLVNLIKEDMEKCGHKI